MGYVQLFAELEAGTEDMLDAMQARGGRPSGLHKVSKLYISDRVSITNLLSCRDEVRRDHRVSGRQGPVMRTRLPTITMPHDMASRTLARLHISPD